MSNFAQKPVTSEVARRVMEELIAMRLVRFFTRRECDAHVMYVVHHQADIDGYDANGMSVREIADLVRDLSSI